MKILIISKCPSHPTNAGNRWWILSQAEMLRNLGHEVHFLYINEMPLRRDIQPYVKSIQCMQDYWKENFHLFNVPKTERIYATCLKIFRKKFCNYHYRINDQYPKGLDRYVNKLDKTNKFNICVINYYYLSPLFDRIKIPKKAIATHDCFAYKNIKVDQPVLCITASTEAKAMQRCPHIFALQEQEANYFQQLSPNSKVYNLYGNFNFSQTPIVNNKNLLFLSGNNNYNINGIKWFINKILPLIKQRHADVKLIIGGSICDHLKEYKTDKNVLLLGYIDNPFDFYKLGNVAINPVYQGTGLKIKTFEALSYGKITLVHPHSTEGIYKKEIAPLFVANEPLEWVNILSDFWENKIEIYKVKDKIKEYFESLNDFIKNEYHRFLNSKNN